MRILVVDDEETKRLTLADDLAARGHDVVTAVDGEEAVGKLKNGQFDVVVTELRIPKLDGIELLKRTKRGSPADVEVIMMSAHGSIQRAVEAMKLGALDFLTKPFRNEEILPLIACIDQQKRVPEREACSADDWGHVEESIVGRSTGIWAVRRMVEICARTNDNVLLYGETGVGKDLVASVIHQISRRRDRPLVKVGCALLSPQLIESELYGHERGSFTGADQQRKGRLDLAQAGTLYLDDVDDIPLDQQAKLLRVIEEKLFERVGGSTPIQADVRIVASTKQRLLDKIAEGTFRQDLYYRLDVLRINIPPLRERYDDVPLLAHHLLERIAQDRPHQIDPDAIDILRRHDWPGNVRELYHTLNRAYLVGVGRITADFLLADAVSGIAPRAAPPARVSGLSSRRRNASCLETPSRRAGGIRSVLRPRCGSSSRRSAISWPNMDWGEDRSPIRRRPTPRPGPADGEPGHRGVPR